jgi:hypothetical protein
MLYKVLPYSIGLNFEALTLWFMAKHQRQEGSSFQSNWPTIGEKRQQILNSILLLMEANGNRVYFSLLMDRNVKFTEEEANQFSILLFASVKSFPCRTITAHAAAIQGTLPMVNNADIKRKFKQWHWSLKKPSHQQLQKYSIVNIGRYLQHVTGILQFPVERLKYLDESHFVSRDMQPKLSRGEEGEKVRL